jgi:tetratricopeptide (TPR) repeat protein
MEGEARYWAFLSYSHHDRRLAERLHRALETYRLPQRLVGRQGPMGKVPGRLHPIFRDRDELTASSQIGPVVKAALAASRALIVLCSPAAAGSSWVDGEIAAFRSAHPNASVLCVLCSGEPLASRNPATASNECMPPALRAQFDGGVGVADTTPLAADLRPQGDGWRLGVQKLVAGLAGVPLDQLVQRDAMRRHRRMGWLAAALAMIAIALGTMAIFALQARDEARRQRVQAEGLIEFMLGDLRKKLEPVGRLDVLDAVGARALNYYDNQDPRSLNANALGRRSQALHLIGDISDRRGDIAAAQAAFRRASDTTSELLKRAPNDGQRIFDHAQSVFWVGYMDWQHGDTAAAEQAFLEYQRLANRLVAKDPTNMDWLAEVGSAHSNLGTLLLEQDRAAEAIPQFLSALQVDQRISASAPGDTSLKLALGQGYSWLSSAYFQNLEFARSNQQREQEIALYDALLAREPNNAQVIERSMFAHRFLAELRIADGNLGAAAAEIAMTMKYIEPQLKLDPDNTDWQQAAAKTELLDASIAMLQGQFDRAQGLLQTATQITDELLKHDANVMTWRLELHEALALSQADCFRRSGRLADATSVVAESQRRLQAMAREVGAKNKVGHWQGLAAGLQAQISAALGNRADADSAWKEVVARFGNEGPHARPNAESLLMLMLAYRAREDGSAADAIQHELQQAGYRHPDFIAALAIARASSTRTAQEGP